MDRKFTISDVIDARGIFSDGDWVESKDQDPLGDVRLIQLADIGDGRFIDKSNRFLTEEKAKQLKCTFLNKGDILVARMPDPIGRACVFPGVGQKAVTVVDVCVIRPNNPEVYQPFLKYLINSEGFRNDIKRHVTGTTRKRISRGNLNKIKFHLPGLGDQKRITKVLSDCEVLIQKRKDSLNLLEELLKSTFLKMFGDPVRNEKGWETKSIEQLVTDDKYSIKRGPFGGALKKEIFVEDGYLVYEQFHALNNDFTMARYFIDERKFKELKAFEVNPGDIIISCSGVNLGRLAVVPENAKKGIINQALLKVTLDQSKMLNSMFLAIFSNPNFKKKFFGVTRGSGVPNFPPMSSFKKFEFIKPPIEQQKKYAEFLNQVSMIKEKLATSLQELENLHASLSQRAFKGELDLSKIEITDMEEIPEDKPELEPVDEPRRVGRLEVQDYQVHIDEIIKSDFQNITFSFKQLEEAITDRGVMVPYESMKEFVFKSLEGEQSLLIQEMDDQEKQIVFKIR
ncbi:MAG: restriction endonuclease subunit S [Balneolales bacterium]|nr:restriction endonuclease subunit S [Balneolales bacterium]